MRFVKTLCFVLCLASFACPSIAQDERTKKLIEDRETFADSADWYYNDLERGFNEAKRTKKPLLVVLRCVPCEACKVFDEQVAHDDPKIKELLDQFVCVRVIKTNGLDLTLFQSDFDQSFAVFMMNGDRTIYGRYGTRPETPSQESEMSLDGFAETLREALALHKEYPGNREQLFGKSPLPQAHRIPEDLPELQKYREFSTVKNLETRMCIHCHQIREAQRLEVRKQRNSPTDSMASLLFTWPSTRALGFALDPKTAATVSEVAPNSEAAAAGLRPGDKLRAVNGQPVISLADVKWALDHAHGVTETEVTVERDGEPEALKLALPTGWKARTDISSRASTWDLRRMATGGLVLEDAGETLRGELKLPADKLALRVKYVGQYGDHAVGKNAGFQEGDVIVEFDGHDDPWRETDLIAFGVTERKPGDKLPVVVLRGGERLELMLPMQ
jgi:serine protease Do